MYALGFTCPFRLCVLSHRVALLFQLIQKLGNTEEVISMQRPTNVTLSIGSKSLAIFIRALK